MDEYPERVAPSFRSTEQSFIVCLKNLNYGKSLSPFGDEVGIDNGIDNGVDNNSNRILNALNAEPKATQKKLSQLTGLSTRSISREIKDMCKKGIIRRIGSDRQGYWEIISNNLP